MGVPVLFTDSGSAPDLVVVPFPGLFLEDELYLGDDLYLDEGPVLQFYAVAPTATSFGITVSVDPVEVTFSATVPGVNVTDVVVAVFPLPVQFLPTDVGMAGTDAVEAVAAAQVTFGATLPETSGSQLLILIPSVRELPPLRLSVDVETPAGRHFRWGADEVDPSKVPSGVRFSDTMPGGFDQFDCTLQRKTAADSDMERLSTVRVVGAGGELAWEGRLERIPRSSGTEVSLSPSAVGYQASLDDDKSAQMIYLDGDLTKWAPMSAARNSSLPTWNVEEPSVQSNDIVDPNNPLFGRPELWTSVSGPWVAGRLPLCEAWYDAGPGVHINTVWYNWRVAKTSLNTADTNWAWAVYLSNDELATVNNGTGNLHLGTTSSTGGGILQAFPGTPRRYGLLQLYYTVSPSGAASDGVEFPMAWTTLRVVGDHGRPVYSIQAPEGGMLASDIVAHAVLRWAPELKLKESATGTVRPSSFLIQQMVFDTRTTAGEIVKQASRFGLQDWAVWDNKTFWWHDRGAVGRKWRARVGPAQLEETGPQVDRLWESVVVEYQDVDGKSRTVGPPGSGADSIDAGLKDTDPTNPANLLGIVRRALLTMGTGTRESSIKIGQRFLQEQKLLDRSGRAQLLGHVEDDRGVQYPYWMVRAGDYITFIDASDTSYRRIVRTEKDHDSRTCSVDLDSPPEGLQALLERYGVGITDLGFN